MTPPKAETSLAILFMYDIEHSSALSNFLKEDKGLYAVCVT